MSDEIPQAAVEPRRGRATPTTGDLHPSRLHTSLSRCSEAHRSEACSRGARSPPPGEGRPAQGSPRGPRRESEGASNASAFQMGTIGRRSMHQRRTRLLPAICGSVVNTFVVALVLPLRITACASGGQGGDRNAKRLRVLTAGSHKTPWFSEARERFCTELRKKR